METLTNEINEIMTEAFVVAKDFGLKEICSETLLYVIAHNRQYEACDQLENTGYEINILKAHLKKRLKSKTTVTSGLLADITYSTAVEGLMALNAFVYGGKAASSMQLMATIIRNNNTAAARLLRSQRISLDFKNQLNYKPLIN